LKVIFNNSLKRGKKEVKINNGRKRIDIVFENYDDNGFFARLSKMYQIFCPKILIECKNYNSDPDNPEVDQVVGRLGRNTGRFGILVCRKVENKKVLIDRCKAAMNNDQGYIIFLTDRDIKTLLELREKSDDEGIMDHLLQLWDHLIL